MLTGVIFREGHLWGALSDAIGAFTQGDSRAHAAEMLVEVVELRAERPGFKAFVTDFISVGDDAYVVVIDANDSALLIGTMLKYQRDRRGLSVEDVTGRLSASTRNDYEACEMGTREPTLSELREMLGAIAPELKSTVGFPDPASALPARKRRAAR